MGRGPSCPAPEGPAGAGAAPTRGAGQGLRSPAPTRSDSRGAQGPGWPGSRARTRIAVGFAAKPVSCTMRNLGPRERAVLEEGPQAGDTGVSVCT